LYGRFCTGVARNARTRNATLICTGVARACLYGRFCTGVARNARNRNAPISIKNCIFAKNQKNVL